MYQRNVRKIRFEQCFERGEDFTVPLGRIGIKQFQHKNLREQPTVRRMMQTAGHFRDGRKRPIIEPCIMGAAVAKVGQTTKPAFKVFGRSSERCSSKLLFVWREKIGVEIGKHSHREKLDQDPDGKLPAIFLIVMENDGSTAVFLNAGLYTGSKNILFVASVEHSLILITQRAIVEGDVVAELGPDVELDGFDHRKEQGPDVAVKFVNALDAGKGNSFQISAITAIEGEKVGGKPVIAGLIQERGASGRVFDDDPFPT